MKTWAQNLTQSSALMNDFVRQTYTDDVLLPYLNISRSELQEIFELNDIPVTQGSSSVISVPAGTDHIGFKTNPSLPVDLVEISQLFESQTGQNNWIPVVKKEYLTPSLLNNASPIAQFGVWAWLGQEIRLIASVQANDLRLDYKKSLFYDLDVTSIQMLNDIINTDMFFQYRTAALAAEFIDENITRADKLNQFASSALDRVLGVNIKGKQVIAVRRRPFRAAFKSRRMIT